VETILRHRQQAQINGWHLSALSGEVALAISTLMRGEFAKGVRSLESLIERVERDIGWRTYAAWGRIYLAEFYITLLRGIGKPSPGVLLKNLLFLLRTRPVAARKAEALLREAMTDPWFSERGVTRARIEFDLGEICLATGRPVLARTHFETARVIAIAQRASNWLAKIDVAAALLETGGCLPRGEPLD
jgi:hypothetical protein